MFFPLGVEQKNCANMRERVRKKITKELIATMRCEINVYGTVQQKRIRCIPHTPNDDERAHRKNKM